MKKKDKENTQNLFVKKMSHFLLKKKYILLFYIFLVFILSFFLHKRASSFSKKERKDAIETKKIYDEWKTSFEESSFRSLNGFLIKNEFLAYKYNNKIIQRLLFEGKYLEKETKIKKEKNENLKELLDSYYEFSNISFFISQDKIKEALDLSYKLEKSIEEKNKETTLLYLYNLLRIAILEKKRGNFEKEQIVLKKLDKALKEKNKAKGNLFLEKVFKKDSVFYEYLKSRNNG